MPMRQRTWYRVQIQILGEKHEPCTEKRIFPVSFSGPSPVAKADRLLFPRTDALRKQKTVPWRCVPSVKGDIACDSTAGENG